MPVGYRLINYAIAPFSINMLKYLQVELTIEPGQSLGLMIRGGLEYNLGIFVTGVDKDSVADRSGIQVKYLNTKCILCSLDYEKEKKGRAIM